VRGVLRRIRGAEYLKRLAEESAPTTENHELARLKAYLQQWANHQHAYRVGPERVGESTLADFYKSRGQSASESLDSEGWAMSVIDSSIDDLLPLQDGTLMRASLRVRYLNEGVSAAAGIQIRVFRSGRLEGISMEAADGYADAAEMALIPIVKRRGLPL
jgi:hypothetical protein